MGDAGPLTATQIYRRDSTGIVAINAVTSEGEIAGGSGAEVGGSGVEGGIEGGSGARAVWKAPTKPAQTALNWLEREAKDRW